MKKLLIVFILFFAFNAIWSTSLFSQVKYTSSGNFGIGEQNPTARLELKMDGSMKGIQMNCLNYDVDLALRNGSSYGFYWRYKGTGTGNNNDLELWTDGQSGSDVQVYDIHQDGNIGFMKKVGIGTNPSYNFHIQGSNPIALMTTTGTNHYLRLCEGTNSFEGTYFKYDAVYDALNIGIHDPATTSTSDDKNILVMWTNNGHIDFYPQGTAYNHQTFITHPNNYETQCYNVKLGSSDNFWVDGDGDVWHCGLHTISDVSIKENIQDLESSLDIISQLRPVKYNFVEGVFGEKIESTVANDDKIKYGLIAQEVEEVIPEIVSLRHDSLKSISYLDLIPILIEAVKEQQSQITSLNDKIESLTNGELKSAQIITSLNPDIDEIPSLFQNHPNPFNEQTVIKYSIPNIESYATLNIYNLQGAQVKSFKISAIGFGEVIVPASNFSPGIFIYNLIVDGIEIDSKRMILTD